MRRLASLPFLVAALLLCAPRLAAEPEALVLLDEASSIEKWTGLEAVSEPVKSGDVSARWVGAGTGVVARIECGGADWGHFNLLVVDLHSNRDDGAEIIVNCTSDNEDTEGGDYYMFRLRVDWTGWRELRIPFHSFGVARRPKGWTEIDAIAFHSRGWNMTPAPGTVLHLDNLRLEHSPEVARRAPPERKKTPRITLPPWSGTLAFPEFPWDEVFALAEGDHAAGTAWKSLLAQARRLAATPAIERESALEDIPENQRDGRYKYAGDNAEVFVLAMHDCRTNNMLNTRMVPVALAARRTGEQPLIDYVVRQLREVATWRPLQRPGWTAYNPERKLPPGGDGNWLATGYGMRAIVHTLSILGEHIPDDVRSAMRDLIQAEIDSIVDDWTTQRPWFVRADFPATNQWVLPSAALVYASMYLGDERNREAYEMGVTNLARTCLSQGDDGSWREGFGYGQMSAEYIFWAAWALARAGDRRLLDYGFCRNFSNWFIHMAMPGGYSVNAFDCGGYRLSNRPHNSLLLSTLLVADPRSYWAVDHLFDQMPDSMLGVLFRHHLAMGSQELQAPESYAFFPSQQVLTWRSDWDQDVAMGLWLRGGSHRDSHCHRDNGHISVYNGRQLVLIECGTPSYADPDMEKYAAETGHNILQAAAVRPRGRGCYTPIDVHGLDREGGSVTIDGTNAYTDVQEWLRRVQWHRQGWVNIDDSVTLKHTQKPGKELFRFHTGSAIPVDIAGTGQHWRIAWDGVSIGFTADAPVTVTQSVWPDRSGVGEHACVHIGPVAAASSLALTTRIEFERPQAKFADLPGYEEYLATVRSSYTASAHADRIVVLQGEDMIGSDKRFTISTSKVGAQTSFLNWDHVGQKIEGAFRLDKSGMYRILIKNCTGANHGTPVRSLQLNGTVPFREAAKLMFPSTGGWSNETDDWEMRVLGQGVADDGFDFHLAAGEHTLTMINEGGGGLNVDYLAVYPAAMNKEELVKKLEPERSTANKARDDLTLVRERLVAQYQGHADANRVRKLMAALKDDGTWPDVDYNYQDRTYWKPIGHLGNVYLLVRALTSRQSELRHDAELEAAVFRALDHWFEHDYQCPNWWWNVIGTPMNLSKSLLLLDERLTGARQTAALKIMERAKIGMTGQNLVWVAQLTAERGVLARDEDLVATAFARLAEEIHISTGEGLQEDFSFHQHGPCLYSHGYGAGFARDCASAAALVAGTKFAYPQEKIDLLASYVLDGSQWLARGAASDPGAEGRETSRRGQNARYLAAVANTMLRLPTGREEEFRQLSARIDGRPDATPLVGNRHFWRSDIMVHHRPAFYASARMVSSRIVNTDSPCNGEGIRNHHIADGATFIMQDGSEYLDIFPVWDWRKIPGTTVALVGELEGNPRRQGKRSFVGGVSDGKYGLAAFDFEFGALRARKAWLFCDDEFVCIGTDIASSGGRPVVTTVNQCFLRGEVLTGSGHGKPLAKGEHVLTGPGWVHHDRVGYVFPTSATVRCHNDIRKGNWNRISTSLPDDEIAHEVFTLWIEHGVDPAGAAYGYLVMPGATAEETAARAREPNIEVLQNEPNLQAIRHPGLDLTGIAFYKPGEVRISETLTVGADRPCLVLLRQQRNRIALSVSNPENEEFAVNLDLSVLLKGEDVSALPDGRGSRVAFQLTNGASVNKSLERMAQ